MIKVQSPQVFVSRLGVMSLLLGGILITACGKEKSSRKQDSVEAADATAADVLNPDTQVIVASSYAQCPALSDDESEQEDAEDDDKQSEEAEPSSGKGQDKSKEKSSQKGKNCPNGTSPAPAPSPVPTPAPTPAPALDGAALHNSLCMGCHGSKAQSSIGNKSFAAIKSAMSSVGAHRNIAATPDAQLTAISQYLMAP